MNAELTKKSLEKVGNPHILVNLISRRVRQLNGGSGGISRPLIEVPPGYGAADIALLELIEDKFGYEVFGDVDHGSTNAPPPKRRRKAAAAAA